MAIVPFHRRYPSSTSLSNLTDEFERLWEDTFRGFPLVEREPFAASADIWQDDKNIHVMMDLPGLEAKDINATIRDGMLVVQAKREMSKEEREREYLRSERFRGVFYREIALSTGVDQEHIKAGYKNGVLHVTLPKKEEARAKGTEIKIEQ